MQLKQNTKTLQELEKERLNLEQNERELKKENELLQKSQKEMTAEERWKELTIITEKLQKINPEIIKNKTSTSKLLGKKYALYEAVRELIASETNFRGPLKEGTNELEKLSKNRNLKLDLTSYKFLTSYNDPFANINVAKVFSQGKSEAAIKQVCEALGNYITDQNIREAFVDATLQQNSITKALEQAGIILGSSDPTILVVQRTPRYRLLVEEILKQSNYRIENDEIVKKPGASFYLNGKTLEMLKQTLDQTKKLATEINEAKRQKEQQLAQTTINQIFDNNNIEKVFNEVNISREQPFDQQLQPKAASEITNAIKTGSPEEIEENLRKWGFVLGTEGIGNKIKQNYYYSLFVPRNLANAIKAANTTKIKAKTSFLRKLFGRKRSSTLLIIDKINKAYAEKNMGEIGKNLSALGLSEEQANNAIEIIKNLSAPKPVLKSALTSSATSARSPISSNVDVEANEQLGIYSLLAQACLELQKYSDDNLFSQIEKSSLAQKLPTKYSENPSLIVKDKFNHHIKEWAAYIEKGPNLTNIDINSIFIISEKIIPPNERSQNYTNTVDKIIAKATRHLTSKDLFNAVELLTNNKNLITEENQLATLLLPHIKKYYTLLTNLKEGIVTFNEKAGVGASVVSQDMHNELENSLMAGRKLILRSKFGPGSEIANILAERLAKNDYISKNLLDKSAMDNIFNTISTKQPEDIVKVLEKYNLFSSSINVNEKLELAEQIKQDFYFNAIALPIREKIRSVFEQNSTKIHATSGSTIKIDAALSGKRSSTQYSISELNKAYQERNTAKFRQHLEYLGLNSNQAQMLTDEIKKRMSQSSAPTKPARISPEKPSSIINRVKEKIKSIAPRL